MVDDIDEGALILAWCRGNRDAAEMAIALFEASHLADDIVDGDSRDVCADMTKMLVIFFSRVMTNKFFLAHAERFAGAIVPAAIDWQLSTEWQDSPDLLKQHYAYVLREALEHVFVIIADLVDGPEHAINVRRQVMDLYHIDRRQREPINVFELERAAR